MPTAPVSGIKRTPYILRLKATVITVLESTKQDLWIVMKTINWVLRHAWLTEPDTPQRSVRSYGTMG